MTRKRPGSLFANFSSIFRQRGITVIQFLALTLICTGTLLGYTYYTSNGKTGEYLNNTKVYVEPTYIVGQQEEKMLDMEQDGIAEYYETNSPNFVRIEGMNTEGQDTFILADPTFDRGLDDAAVEQFSGVTAVGCLEQTFLICDEPISGYTGKIRFTADEEKQAIVEDSLPQYQNFFEPGQLGTKELYRVQTRLTNGDTLERLRPYLTAGEINPEQLNAGKQVLLVLNAPEETFQVAGGIILWMQRIMEQAYEKMMGLEESMIHYEEIEPQVEQLMQRYFLANRCWSVPVAKPILLLLLVMCTLTLLLTWLGIRRFRGSIADSINNGRERQ